MSEQERPILTVEDLAVSFPGAGARRVQAVDGVSLTLFPRQTLAVVGESGSGKSVTALSTLRLLPSPPSRVDRGRILLSQADGGERDLLKLNDAEIRSVRGGDVAMIFQEPMTSLNPVYTIGEQLVEAVVLHQGIDQTTARRAAVEAMTEVGIVNAEGRLDAYPHQFSGGMRQRVMIAMALACQPRVLLADEPTTALDVTVQAQILELLRSLQERRGLAIMLITHALGVVAQNADVVAVMYGGRVVEYAKVEELFANPVHPYTRGLLASIPRTRTRAERLTTIKELIERPGEFEKLQAQFGVRPWWPTHEVPAGVQPHRVTGMSSVLAEISPNHWAAVWRTGRAAQMEPSIPTLAYRRTARNANRSASAVATGFAHSPPV